MSEEKLSLELLGSRVAAMTDRMYDLELRFTALEARFSSFEGPGIGASAIDVNAGRQRRVAPLKASL
jgi:hypothetical protein